MRIFWVISDRLDTKVDKSTIIEMVYEIKKLGIEISVLAGYKEKRYVNDSRNFYPVYFKGINFPFLYRISLLIKIMVYLYKNCKRNDIIITHDTLLWMYAILRMLKKVRIHYDLRTLPVDIHSLKEKFNHLISWKLHNYLFKNVPDSYSFITERIKKSMEDAFKFKLKEKYCFWSSGVNLNICVTNAKQKENDYINLFYHGSITSNRGIGTLIKSVSLLSPDYNIKLIIVGDGKDLYEMKKLADSLEIIKKVEFLGFVLYENIGQYISQADICVCPLPNRIEWNVSSPIKIFEYMAFGKPIICTKIPAHYDILGDLPFVVYSGEDEQSIAEAIKYTLKNLDKIKLYKKDEIEFVRENYTWEKQAYKLVSFFKLIYT